jgi:PAS domain S-box-containing protein
METVALHHDQREIPVEASISLVKFGSGWRLNAFVRDLTSTKQSEARFRALLESAPDAMVITDDAGVIRLANRQAERLFGYSSHEFIGLPVDTLLPPRFREAHTVHRQSYAATPQPRAMGVGLDLWAVNKYGREFPVEVSLSPLHLQSGLLISSAIRDITWRRELEADRRRFVYLAEQSQDFIGMCDTAFVPFYVNDAGRRLVGLDDLEHARRVTVGDFFFHEDRAFIEHEFFPRVVRDGHGAVEIRFRHFRTGEAIWMNYRVSNLRDERGDILGWATISSDVTTRRQAEAALRVSLDEKETLLREVHHRVKNNLAVIGSLLYLQSTYITDPVLRRVLQESQERVRSMALVHERLYRSRDVAQVDFAEYVRELAAELSRNYATTAGSPTLTFDLSPMVMDLDRAALSGLVLNETISNALKHAFPDRRRATIRIGLRETPGGFVLSVADNGVGLPAGAAGRQSRSLGMRLMHALASQLDGRVEFHDANPGTEVRLVVEKPDVRD